MPLLRNIPAGNLDISDQIIYRINQMRQELSLEDLRKYSLFSGNDLHFTKPYPYYKLLEVINKRYLAGRPTQFKLVIHLKPVSNQMILHYWDDAHMMAFSNHLEYIAQVAIGNFDQENAWTYKLKRGGHLVDLFLFIE